MVKLSCPYTGKKCTSIVRDKPMDSCYKDSKYEFPYSVGDLVKCKINGTMVLAKVIEIIEQHHQCKLIRFEYNNKIGSNDMILPFVNGQSELHPYHLVPFKRDYNDIGYYGV